MATKVPDTKREEADQLTDQPQEPSSIADTHVEEKPPWAEFKVAALNENGHYAPPTEAEKIRHQSELTSISEIFEGANFHWSIDGASNISLYEGKQIRAHKDKDIGIMSKDIVAVSQHLRSRGYGIFSEYEENGRRLMRPFEASDADKKLEFTICKISPDGKLDKAHQGLNSVDLHLNHETPSNKIRVSYNNAELPKDWFKVTPVKLPNGKTINASNPMLVIYHKLNHGRDYDLSDAKIAAKHLAPQDLETLIGAYENEKMEVRKLLKSIPKEFWGAVHTIYEFTSDPATYKEALWSTPSLKSRRGDKKTEERVDLLAEAISKEKPDQNSMSALFERLFQPFVAVDKKIAFLNQFKTQPIRLVDKMS